MSDTPNCAHMRVTYRTEDYPLSQEHADEINARRPADYDGPYAPVHAGMTMTRGWWECDSGCGSHFIPTSVRALPGGGEPAP